MIKPGTIILPSGVRYTVLRPGIAQGAHFEDAPKDTITGVVDYERSTEFTINRDKSRAAGFTPRPERKVNHSERMKRGWITRRQNQTLRRSA